MNKRKERSLVELYKRAVKVSKPRVTPILEGNCRMQGPLDEFGSEFEADKVCNTEDRTAEESLVATVDCSISTGMGVTRKESSDDHCIGKPVTRNTVQREEISGSVKTRVNMNTRSTRGSKIRETDMARNHADYRQDVEERKSGSVTEGNEKFLESPEISQSNCKEEFPSAEKQSEETHEKHTTDKHFDVTNLVGNSRNGDIDVSSCCHEDNMKEQVGAERELLPVEPKDVNNMDSRDSDNVETSSNKKNPETCNMALTSVENEVTKEETGSKDLPGLRASMSFQSFKGIDSDLHLPGNESAGMLGIHFNGGLCNVEDITENPTKLENTDNLAETHAESHAETNIMFSEGTSSLPNMVDTENVTTSALPGKMHSGKVAFGKVEDSVDVIGKVQLPCSEDKFLLQNDNIEGRTSANANEATADGYCNHSFPGYSLCLAGVEHADMAVEYGPLDHSSSSSLHKGPPNRITAEENISQEAFSSLPLSITSGQSSVTLHASQCIAIAKEIEAHSSCQQEDLVFGCSPKPTEISSTKNPISTAEEVKDVALVFPEVLPKGPDYHRDECVKSNFSAGFLATSSVPSVYSKFGSDINQVPVEVGPDLQLESGEQLKEVAKEDTSPDAGIKLEENFHIDKANINVGPSEMASCSEGSHICQSFIEKSSEPLPAEDDQVKVCDICGDTGYEEMLAVCSMCNDGAEHTYCMPNMLDEVPEGDWLCEGCKLQQNVSVKRVETTSNLRMVLKPACLTSMKHNYGTSRSRLSAKLDKMKIGLDRQRAIKGTLSSQLSSKRQAEGFEVGRPMKKLAFQASNGHSGSLIPNANPVISRENSFKLLDIRKVKTSSTVSPTGNSLSSSLHDCDNSSTLLRASSPRLSTNMQYSKNKFASPNGLATDPSAFTGTSKAGSNVSSTGLVTLIGKSSADITFPSHTPARLSSLEKLSANPKIINDSTEAGFQSKAARENMSNICTVGGISKSLKSTTNAILSVVSESMLTSGIEIAKIKEMRTGKVRKDGSDLSRGKFMAMPLCKLRNPLSAGVTNFENLATDGTCVKPVTCPIKDSSKSIWSEEKTAVALTQVLPHSNKKEHSSIRFSGEGQAQLKASPNKLQEGTATNKLQRAPSIKVVHNVAAKKLKGVTSIDATSGLKSVAEGNISSSIEDSKKNSCTKVVAEDYPSELGKKGGNLQSKSIPNNNLVYEIKKSGNSENFSSLKQSSQNHPPAVGPTRCYKCKQLGHPAQSCTNHSLAEARSNRLRVSTLISPSTRSSKEILDTGNCKLSTSETTLPGNITGCQNSQSSGKRQLNFESAVGEHVQLSGSSSPRQDSGNQEMSYADLKSNSTLPSKSTTDLNGKLDVKNSENKEFSASNVDLAGCSITTPQILASRPWKSPLFNHSTTASKINEESISHTGFNERKRTEWIANSRKYLPQRRLEEGEGRFLTRDSSHIATTAITQPAVHPAEGKVVAIGGNTSYGQPYASDASEQPHTELKVVPRQQSSHPESVKATIFPEHNFLWQGGFEVRNKANSFNYFDGIQAHASTCAASKVLDAVKKFSSKLQLEEVPRCSSWPVQFQYSHPSDENIALYFFAKDHESYGKSYRLLLEHILKNDFALRGNFDGVELLVFPSNQLPEKSQRWNRLLFLWGVFRGRNSGCTEPSTCSAAFSAAAGIDADKDGGGESCAPARALRTFGNRLQPSVSDQGEKPNGSCFNIPNSSSVKDGKAYNAQKNDDNAAGRLLLVEKDSMRLGDPDLPPGFDTITAKKPHNRKDDIICQSKSIQEDGSGKTVESGTNEEVSSSHKTSQKEEINFKSGYTPGPSTISLSSTEKLTYSCITSRIAFCDSPGQRSEIDKGKGGAQNTENVREMERIKEMEFARLRSKDDDMDQECRSHEKESEKNRATLIGEREKSHSPSKQEDYGNHESKPYRDEMYHPCLSHSHSPPRDVVQSHSPKLHKHNYDQKHVHTQCSDLDRINCLQPSSGKQHEFVGSPIEKSSNDIIVAGKEGQRKLKSESEIQGRQSREEQDQSGRVSAEPKMAGVPTYQIADLNRVPDYDSALEFSGAHVPQDSKMTGTMLYPGPEDIRVNCRLSKLSEEWRTGLGSNQNSSGPSTSGQFASITEENIQERPDLNIPILELSLGGKKSSSNPAILPLSTNLLSNSPIKSSLVEGIEHGSSLSLSLAFPLSQKDQTAKTLKEEQQNPANCSVNTICLFGRRVDC